MKQAFSRLLALLFGLTAVFTVFEARADPLPKKNTAKTPGDAGKESSSSSSSRSKTKRAEEKKPEKTSTDQNDDKPVKDSDAKENESPLKQEKSPDSKSDEPKKETPAEKTEEKTPAKEHAPAAKLKPEDLKEFSTAPETVREPLRYALSLTERNLTYSYGSADPDAGGMDCSGTIYHVLQKHGWSNVPRQSNEMYQWTWEAGTFRAFNGNSMATFELKQLQPGDLMFWTNTVGKSDRDPPITHVMMYLGKKNADGKPVMFGASDGRTYDGVQRWGVSVFDFVLPREGNSARFIGYAHLPEKLAKPAETKETDANSEPESKPKPKTASKTEKTKPKAKSSAPKKSAKD